MNHTNIITISEAHTRGVDLKMPADAVAALTLGIMQTKDHTVQGQYISYVDNCEPSLDRLTDRTILG